MALRGNLKDFSLPDVFQLVTFSRKSGVLRIRRADGAKGSVWFRVGDVYFAQSNWHAELLGERLVRAQRLTSQALERALSIRAVEGTDGRRLGQILVDEGYISHEVLESFVSEQIQETIFDLMRWDEGEFDFEATPDIADEDIGLSISIENVVMEGSRRLEEWGRIRRKIPSTDVVFKMATAPGEGTFEISLKPLEWNLLLLVDGTRSIAELAVATDRTDFEVARVIYGLFSAGLLEFPTDDEVERLRAERTEREARLAEVETQRKALIDAQTAEAQERESALEASAQARAHNAVTPQAPPVAGEQPTAPAEVPRFLSGQLGPSAEDAAVLEEMIGAVLRPETAPVAEKPVERPDAPINGRLAETVTAEEPQIVPAAALEVEPESALSGVPVPESIIEDIGISEAEVGYAHPQDADAVRPGAQPPAAVSDRVRSETAPLPQAEPEPEPEEPLVGYTFVQVPPVSDIVEPAGASLPALGNAESPEVSDATLAQIQASLAGLLDGSPVTSVEPGLEEEPEAFVQATYPQEWESEVVIADEPAAAFSGEWEFAFDAAAVPEPEPDAPAGGAAGFAESLMALGLGELQTDATQRQPEIVVPDRGEGQADVISGAVGWVDESAGPLGGSDRPAATPETVDPEAFSQGSEPSAPFGDDLEFLAFGAGAREAAGEVDHTGGEVTADAVQEEGPDFSELIGSLDLDVSEAAEAAPTGSPGEQASDDAMSLEEPLVFDEELLREVSPSTEVSGVISTDAFLEDIGEGALGYSGGLTDELSALTGVGRPSRPTANVNRIPDPNAGDVLRRDLRVDRGIVLKIIDGIKNL